MAECPGHFGYIELAKPVFHVGMMAMTKKKKERTAISMAI